MGYDTQAINRIQINFVPKSLSKVKFYSNCFALILLSAATSNFDGTRFEDEWLQEQFSDVQWGQFGIAHSFDSAELD